MIGETVGSYRITALLGEGGMGEVYLAEHTLIGRRAAVKVLLREHAGNPEVLDRFFTEARVAALVKHPGIIDIFDYGNHRSGAAFIVMDYLEGESLAGRLQREPILPPELAVEIARQVALALGAAHAAGVVHRDLKPDNVFLVASDDVEAGFHTKILDFGIAKLVGPAAGKGKRTQTGMVFGTPHYMSPEQCRGTRKIDGRSDLYSLGCMLFEMLCGRTPFVADEPGDMVVAHITLPPPGPRSLVPSLPDRLDALVLRLLSKAPADRYESAPDLVKALEDLRTLIPRVRPSRHGIPRVPILSPAHLERPSTLGAAASQSIAPYRQRSTAMVVAAAALVSLAMGGFLAWRLARRGVVAPPPVAAVTTPTVTPLAPTRPEVPSEPPNAAALRDGKPIDRTPPPPSETPGAARAHRVVAARPPAVAAAATPPPAKEPKAAGEPAAAPPTGPPPTSPPPAGKPDAASQARMHLRMADALLKAGSLDQARAEILEAQRISPDPENFYRLGELARKKGDRRQAFLYYRQYILANPDGEHAAEASRFVAEITADTPTE